MHFEILVEGKTELTALSILMPKIVGAYGEPHTWKIHKHRGVGQLPADPQLRPNARDMTLLHQLPAKLRAYAKIIDEQRVVVVLLDLDDKNSAEFLQQLESLLNYCQTPFEARFQFAIEELEAWYLGDVAALQKFNPKIKSQVLEQYQQDSICGTWEKLAEADEPTVLNNKKRSTLVMDKKKEWAKKIPLYMEVIDNKSPSFQDFVRCLQSYI
ncbi:hypothetical protein VR7878_01818 [Vibrio ruber DSM 16370]|uniref:DUF4276 domain-containing protein n=1 Tax=Vibrio ruber (strain DSM 16370 / JCM 11486 / BCRC 17186 / CECT 7878 / LMG 23124 / VR1) TaxID=1123498 RepID=A0A1R4LJ77_VIBR1|nr:DUF4276 family protein [Vibrio ruber]SJN56523.1 hypothetical protein VR7878_01818 [Vibrio ruber DSM 16370]